MQPYDGDKRFGAQATAETTFTRSSLSVLRAYRHTSTIEQPCSVTTRAGDGHRGHTTAAQSQ